MIENNLCLAYCDDLMMCILYGCPCIGTTDMICYHKTEEEFKKMEIKQDD